MYCVPSLAAFGPVPTEGVPPVFTVQSKSSVISWVHAPVPDSKPSVYGKPVIVDAQRSIPLP